MFASVKLMSGLAVDIPMLKAPIIMANGPLFVKSISSESSEEPGVAVTDWPDRIRSARAVAEPKRKKALPATNKVLNSERCFVRLAFVFTLDLQLLLSCPMILSQVMGVTFRFSS